MATLIVHPDRLLPAEPGVRAIARRLDRLGVGEGPLRQAPARIGARRTTDAPADDLDVHARLGEDPEITTRITPTFRPDGYLAGCACDGGADGPAGCGAGGHGAVHRVDAVRAATTPSPGRPPTRSVDLIDAIDEALR